MIRGVCAERGVRGGRLSAMTAGRKIDDHDHWSFGNRVKPELYCLYSWCFFNLAFSFCLFFVGMGVGGEGFRKSRRRRRRRRLDRST